MQGFADAFPILLASEASLRDLNSHMEVPIPITRFRPNIIVRGTVPFEEDSWCRIKIGQDVYLRGVKCCSRCKITTTDQVIMIDVTVYMLCVMYMT